MKKFIVVLLVFLMSFGFTFAGGGRDRGQGGQVRLLAYCPSSLTSVPTRALIKFAELVYTASNGEILITVRHSGELGNDADSLQSTRMGTIDIYFGGTSTFTTFYNRANILDLPFLFQDSWQAYEFVNSPAGADIFSDLPSFGLVFLAQGDNGMRQIATTGRPVHHVNDVSGMRVRVPVSQLYMDVWEALGATPIMLPLPELSIALATGIAEAQDNATFHVVANATYDDIRYFSFINYAWMGTTLAMNSVSWNRLSPEHQRILREQARVMARYTFEAIERDNATAMEFLRARGVQFNMNPDVQSFRNRLGGVEFYRRYANEPWFDQNVINQIMALHR